MSANITRHKNRLAAGALLKTIPTEKYADFSLSLTCGITLVGASEVEGGMEWERREQWVALVKIIIFLSGNEGTVELLVVHGGGGGLLAISAQSVKLGGARSGPVHC